MNTRQKKTLSNTSCIINTFPIQPHKPPTPKPPTSELHREIATTTHTPTHKWVTFTYIGKEIIFITNLVRKTNLKIAFRTNNTIQMLLKHKQQLPDIYTQSGVYKLKCRNCNKAYVGQTGRSFQVRFTEHKNAFKIVTPQTFQNTLMNKHTQSDPSITQCKYYNGKTKGHISTQ